jgi:putative tryptophan/tyrosine transport system substrate-binding protein
MRSLLIALAATVALSLPARADEVTVAVTAIVEHPALDAARDGVKDALAAAGYKEGENLKFIYESAQGNPATAAQIARQFAGEAPSVIVPISTPSAQAVVSSTAIFPLSSPPFPIRWARSSSRTWRSPAATSPVFPTFPRLPSTWR